jgi:undecaprenyl-diphosphatase
MAVLSVALFVLISYWSIVAADPGPTGADTTAFDIAEDLSAGWLEEIAKVVTVLGSFWVAGAVAAVASVVLARERRWLELAVLLVGMVTIVVMNDAIKGWVDRPRPPDGLVETSSPSFPSGHAAYATIYTWLATTVAFRLDPSITRRGLLIVAGAALTVVVGLTRVYLRVHWMSDVTSGWALGLSVFSAAAAVALLVTHFRNNQRPDVSRT